jgi:hypothetical protein
MTKPITGEKPKSNMFGKDSDGKNYLDTIMNNAKKHTVDHGKYQIKDIGGL